MTRADESLHTGKEIAEFQDDVRDMLLDELGKRHIDRDIDGGGCDSGDWRDFTMDEIQQAFNAVADHYEESENATIRTMTEALLVAEGSGCSCNGDDHEPGCHVPVCRAATARKLAK